MIDRNHIKNLVDGALLDAHSDMLEDKPTVDKFIDTFWDLIEGVYGYILKYIRDKYPEVEKIHLDINDLLFDDLDEERIRGYFVEFQDNMKKGNPFEARIKFLNKLSRIYITEAGFVRDRTFIYTGRLLMNTYHYTVSITYTESTCEEIGGTETDEIITSKRLDQVDIESFYEDELECGHPNCPGHLLDIDIDKEDEDTIVSDKL